jgi:rubrerythrin
MNASVLRGIIADPELHYRWLNTLSLLEFMGARKIARSAVGAPDETYLRHFAEEARHAHFFKRMAERVKPAGVSDCALCPGAAARYFQTLDLAARGALQLMRGRTDYRAYLLVTTLIEERAGQVYAQYEVLLREADSPVRLAGVIGEEERHLDDMRRELGDAQQLELLHQLRTTEAAAFARFDRALARAVAANSPRALAAN